MCVSVQTLPVSVYVTQSQVRVHTRALAHAHRARVTRGLRAPARPPHPGRSLSLQCQVLLLGQRPLGPNDLTAVCTMTTMALNVAISALS